jgi:uncharacterized protein with ATP-grasp and redox domains
VKTPESRPVWTGAECLTCLVTIADEILHVSTTDPKVHLLGMKMTYEILKDFRDIDLPTSVANKIYRMILELTQNPDPFKEVKDQSNSLARNVMERIRTHISMPSDPYTRFYRALSAAIAGNVIDFGTAGHSIELNIDFLEQIYYQIATEGFAIDHSINLFNALTKGKEILYFADNAGEIYFDWFVLDQIKSRGVKTILVVKGAPISNDATLDDVTDPIFREVVTKIITTGTNALGVSLSECSPELRAYLQKVDYIIAKGQSNFETLFYYHKEFTQKPIYFIFRTKCSCIARFIGLTIGKNIVLQKKL